MSFQTDQSDQGRRYLRDKAVGAKIDTSRSQVWRLTKHDPDFPQPIRLSAGHTVWSEDQIDAWVDSKRGCGRLTQ